MSELVCSTRNQVLLSVSLVILLTLALYSGGVAKVPVASADDNKDCDKNKGDNNCNDTKKNVSPKLECKHEIKDNKDSTIDSECTNNSQILIDSNIESPGDGGGGIGDAEPPTVIGVDPADNENNVSLNADINVNFSEPMDFESLVVNPPDIFNLDGGPVPDVQPSPGSTSVTYTPEERWEPSTTYRIQLAAICCFDSFITDKAKPRNGLVCAASNPVVDSNCIWEFTTGTGPVGNPNIELSPTSGPVNTPVHITGTGFDPVTDVIISMGPVLVADITTNNNGEFSGDFDVPGAPPGTFTVTASEDEPSEVSLSATASFTVTSANLSTSTATQGMLPF